MDNFLISKLIYEKCPKLAHKFIGCFPCNTFPPFDTQSTGNQFCLVNTDADTGLGRHWVLIGLYDKEQPQQQQDRANDAPKRTLLYFDSLDEGFGGCNYSSVPITKRKMMQTIPYKCIRNRMASFYANDSSNITFELLKAKNFGIAPQDKESKTCALYCIYMAHIVYSSSTVDYITENDILQFAEEHFQRKFVNLL